MIAEVWASGVPFAYALREGFRVLCLGCISAVTHFLTRLYGQRTGFRCLGRRPAQSSQISLAVNLDPMEQNLPQS